LVPENAYLEAANALVRYVRAGEFPAHEASVKLHALLALPLRAVALHELAEPALRRALSAGLSAYDAGYLVLAEASDAVLVTADRRLAEVAPASALLPHEEPS
jgi:predicted nucleic acid-binding protein